MKIKAMITGLALGMMLVSCEKDYEAETLPGYELSGEWFVQTYAGGTNDSNVVLGYQKILTSNTTSANGNQMWVDDLGNIWPFKVKANITGENTFAVSAGRNESLSSGDTLVVTVTINNGRVFPDGGRSTSGVVVDSIYMEAEFSDDPGSTYIFAGHYRTGFLEDEH